MANKIDNLIPIKKGQRSREEVKITSSKGGIASGEARRKKKTMKELVNIMLNCRIKDKSQIEKLQKFFPDLDVEEMTISSLMLTKQIDKAIKLGDTKSFEVVRDTSGQKPVETIIQTTAEVEITEKDDKILIDSIKKLYGDKL